jgi:hypothetical protein
VGALPRLSASCEIISLLTPARDIASCQVERIAAGTTMRGRDHVRATAKAT